MKRRLINNTFILVLFPIVWSIVIFGLSFQPAEVSSELSGGLGQWIAQTFLPEFWNELEEMSVYELEMWHKVLRKCAHFAEYFVLGGLWIVALRQRMFRHKRLIAIGLCVLTASIDEMIQRFVPGRFGQFTDVLLDSIGATFGVYLIWYVIEKWKYACMKKVNMIQ